MPLTEVAIKNCKPAAKPLKLFDGGGLHLYITPKGSRLWRIKYRFNGIENQHSLGGHPEVSLREARARRDELRKRLRDGIDPARQRKAEKRSRANTFQSVALEWIDEHSRLWTPGYRQLVKRRFERDVFPWIGSQPVHVLEAADFLDVFQRIAKRGALETAHRARACSSEVMRFAVATRRAPRDPIVDLKGALPATRPVHFASITEPKKIGALLRAIEGYEAKAEPVRAALRLAPYVFVRPSELAECTWSEFNLAAAQWRIPPERMKMRLPHIIPLSRQAVAILDELHPYSGPQGYVFPSIRTFQRSISNGTINAALRKLGYTGEEMTGHGFRSMASTVLNEHGWDPNVIERQLSHVEQNDVRAAYNYAEYLPLRKRMMQEWADYLDKLRADKPAKMKAVKLAA